MTLLLVAACASGPVAVIDASPTSGDSPLQVAFAAEESDGAVYAWDFGDGAVADGPTATHHFVGSGGYTATLTVSDGNHTAIATVDIDVDPEPCPQWGPVEDVGVITSAAVTEASGLVASHASPGTLWVHNDSGDDPVVYAMDESGADLGAFELVGGAAYDWEDIARGPEGDLFLADIGDNFEERDTVEIYRVSDPPGEAEALTFVYPDRAHDAEALVIDPITGDLLIVTKERAEATVVFRAHPPFDPGDDNLLEEAATFDIDGEGLPGSTLVTGADFSPLGNQLAVRTYTHVFVLRRDGPDPVSAFDAAACGVPTASEMQGESVAYIADGSAIYTVSEGASQPIHRTSRVEP